MTLTRIYDILTVVSLCLMGTCLSCSILTFLSGGSTLMGFLLIGAAYVGFFGAGTYAELSNESRKSEK